jgi:hypothetical protein
LLADARSGAWLRHYLPAAEPRSRLICLPHAGGSASYFLPVTRALGAETDVLAVQYPGRQDRRGEPLVATIGELADRIFEVLRPLADLPLVLFGPSMGATAAFEVAVRLEAAGLRAAALFASGRRAPSTHRIERVHTLDDDGLLADLRKLGGTDLAVLDGDHKARRKMTVQCVHGKAMQCIEAAISDLTEREIAAWPQNESISLYPLIHHLTIRVIREVIFGEVTPKHSEELLDVLEQMTEFNYKITSTLMIFRMKARTVRLLKAWRPSGLRSSSSSGSGPTS